MIQMLSCLVPRFGQEDMPSSTKFDLQCKKIFFLSFINSLQLVAQERAYTLPVLWVPGKGGKVERKIV